MGIEQAQIQPVTAIRTWQLRALSSAWLVALPVAGFWMALILAIHRNSPRTLVSFHGLLHAAIAGQFLGSASASFPPENPFYAGEPVAYYWFFQYLAAQITRVFGLNIFYSLEAIVLIATGVLMTTAVFLGLRLYRSALAGILIGYLIVAGTNPLGWMFALYQLIRRGPTVLNDNPEHLWGVVHPVFSLIRYNDFGGIYGPLLSFFLNITSRPAALAGLLAMVLCLNSYLKARSSLSFIALGCASAITTTLSPIIGIVAGGTLLISLATTLILDRMRSRVTRDNVKLRMRSTTLAGAAIVVGILAAAPTYYHLMLGPSANHVAFTLFSMEGLRHFITVGLSVFLLLILALAGVIRSPKDQRLFLAILITSALMLLGLDATFTLPAGNGSNLFHTAVVLLAVPGAGSILRSVSDRERQVVSMRMAVVIVLLFLPTTLLLTATYLNRSSVPVSFRTQTLERVPRDSDMGLLYQWVQTKTDQNAIFIVDPRERVAVCGNSLEFPAMTNRAIFTENSNHYIAEPYRDSNTRFALAVRVSSGEKPEAADSVYLSRFNRPIYVVSYRAEDIVLMSRMQEIYGIPAFKTGTVAVFQWPIKPHL